MRANRSWETMLRKAKKKNWCYPKSNPHTMELSWMRYWQAMEDEGMRKHYGLTSQGRPIPPVR